MSDPLQRFIETVVGHAEADPARAPQVYGAAAEDLRSMARRQKNAQTAAKLQALAAEMTQRAQRPATVSDFGDLLSELAESYRQVGDPSDDQAPVARMSEIHDARTSGLPRVSIAPRSIREQTALGRQTTVKWQPTDEEGRAGIKQSQTLALWQGEKHEAQAITVDIGLVRPVLADSNPVSNRPYGLISYGSEGVIINVEVDIGLGMRATVVGSYVSVLVGMDAPLQDNPSIDRVGVAMTIAASIGFFAAPSLAPVIRTRYIDGLDTNATSDFIPRPNKSVLLLPPQSNIPGGTADYKFYDVTQTQVLYSLTLTNGALGNPIPLTDDIVFVTVKNNSAKGRFRLPFQLAL